MSRTLTALAVLLVALPLQAESDDPLAEVYASELRPSVESLLEQFRATRRYATADFPLPPGQFSKFRQEIVSEFVAALGMENWLVRRPEGPQSPIAALYRDRIVKRFDYGGIEIEAHVVEIVETGDTIPVVVCLPPGERIHPGVAVFPGHSRNGLRDLLFDRDSYQHAATEDLAREGFVTVSMNR